MTASHTPEPDPRHADLFSVAANPRRLPRWAAPRSRPDVPALPTGSVPPPAPASNTTPLPGTGLETVAQVPPTGTEGPGTGLATVGSGIPMVLDPFAVATRAVQVLIGDLEPAQHIARAAIGAAIDHDSSAAIDVVVPRAVDIVLRRAAHLVAVGAAPRVVDQYAERLELWRRLATRTGLEPAAVALSLAPYPPATVAHMLRVPLDAVTACFDRWYSGIDPDSPGELTMHASRPAERSPSPVTGAGDHGARPEADPSDGPDVSRLNLSVLRRRSRARRRSRT